LQSWENFLKGQEEALGKESVDKWLRTLKVVHFDACNLYLEAKDAFQVLWFEEHMRPLVRKYLLNNNNRNIKVHLTISDEDVQKNRKEEEKSLTPTGPGFTPDQLDPLATFPNLIETESNAFPLKILYATAGYDPQTNAFAPPLFNAATYNPIYIYGGSGVGKSHLLMALAHAFKNLGLNVLFVRAETFTQHVVKAIRGGEMQEFRKIYRNSDLLIIDDVDLFARRSATQEELFNTFNALHTTHKQIIFSSNAPPGLLEGIEERLISRFEWGITLKLEAPTAEAVKQILDKRSKLLNFPLSQEIFDFLIKTFPDNIKPLLRALDALILRSHLEKAKPARLDLKTAEKYLQSLILEQERAMLNPSKIVRAVADFYGIRVDDIVGKSQKQECTLPRQIAMHICRTKLKMPYMKIGRTFERDHSTVMSSIKQVQKKLDLHDKDLCSSVPAILRCLESSP
jgi:chromosomal replication initiator protein